MRTIVSVTTIAALLFSTSGLFAQTSLIKSITLKYTMDGGTNGCAVTYNPDKKLYYASIAGNEAYPLETFDEHGSSKHTNKVGFDSRGLWYNPGTNQLEGNAQGRGIYAINLDGNGYPKSSSALSLDPVQPVPQSVGVLDEKKKMIVFYGAGSLHFFKAKDGTSAGKVFLKLSNEDDINATTVIYTGIKKKEYGLLNHKTKQVLTFDRKGRQTGIYQLPSNAVTHNVFRFSYANNLVFLYDANSRTWTGYFGLK